MISETTAIIEVALINLTFAQAELTLSDVQFDSVRRALEHIKFVIADLSELAPRFGRLDEVAA